jgi:nitroreductase
MDIIECINTRRSIRRFRDEPVPEETIQLLIELGTKAPSGSNEQPWGFVVIHDKQEIDRLSEEVREFLLKNLEEYPKLQKYERWFRNPAYNFFHHSSNLIAIYGNKNSHCYIYDCSLAAENIMLAAHSMGIGSCWIGFAEYTMNTKTFKEKYHVLPEYELVSILTLGYTKDDSVSYGTRKAPLIFNP